MKNLDHSYEYKTSNERVKIEQELINIAESELNLFAIPDVSNNEVAVCPHCGSNNNAITDNRWCLDCNEPFTAN